jgi:hypothetical protein
MIVRPVVPAPAAEIFLFFSFFGQGRSAGTAGNDIAALHGGETIRAKMVVEPGCRAAEELRTDVAAPREEKVATCLCITF